MIPDWARGPVAVGAISAAALVATTVASIAWTALS